MELDIESLYDDLYNQADKILKKYNPCKIDGDRCLRGINPCCYNCSHIDIYKGCTVKSLGCKLYICSAGRESVDKECLKELLTIRQEAVDNKIPLVDRASKSWVINYIFVQPKEKKLS